MNSIIRKTSSETKISFFAQKNIPKGYDILQSTAMVFTITQSCEKTTCYNCFCQVDQLVTVQCVHCQRVYCCPKCPIPDHPCDWFSQIHVYTADDKTVTLIKLVLEMIYSNREIHILPTNDDKMKTNYKTSAKIISKISKTSKQSVSKLISMVEHSLFQNSSGFFLFLEAVYFNHSCKPNIEYKLDGKKIVFRAIDDIQEGEQLSIRMQNTRKIRSLL